MGKKRKNCSSTDDEHNKLKKKGENTLDDTNIETTKANKKVNKANKQENTNATDSTEGSSASVIPQIEDSRNIISKKNKTSKGKKKQNKTLVDADDSKTVSSHENTISKRATKIKFVDDAPQLDATGSKKQSTQVISKNNNPILQQDEEEVNDEDIDKFCEELTEEDNVQFDDWVKLIEAKLHSKKNK